MAAQFFGFLIQTPAFLTVHQTLSLLVKKFCLDTDNWMSNQMRDPNTLVVSYWKLKVSCRSLGFNFETQPGWMLTNIWQNIEAAPEHEASVLKLLNPMVNSSLSLWKHTTYVVDDKTISNIFVRRWHLQSTELLHYIFAKRIGWWSMTLSNSYALNHLLTMWKTQHILSSCHDFPRIKPPSKEVLHQECSRRIRWNWSHS